MKRRSSVMGPISSPYLSAFAILMLMLVVGPSRPAFGQSDEERDFVPGEKVILYDDYSDMVKGGAPPHWKVRNGSVKQCPDGTCLQLKGEPKLYPNVTAMPKNFTIETELRHMRAMPYGEVVWRFGTAAEANLWAVSYGFDTDPGNPEIVLEVTSGGEKLGAAKAKADLSKPLMLSLWFQDNRLRVYLNQERLVDLNQLELKPWKIPVLEFNLSHADDNNAPDAITLGAVRIAESTPDISQVLFSTGKYTSHGIQFDINSDKLRPESLNILKPIADALKSKPEAKLRIEGHTDSTGDAAKNMDLSKRRADSVKGALVGLGIEASRLTTEGFGQTKPLASNDTVQGRAENRRVEFIKL